MTSITEISLSAAFAAAAVGARQTRLSSSVRQPDLIWAIQP